MLEGISDFNIFPECFRGPLKTLLSDHIWPRFPHPGLQYFRTQHNSAHTVLPLCWIHYVLVLYNVHVLPTYFGFLINVVDHRLLFSNVCLKNVLLPGPALSRCSCIGPHASWAPRHGVWAGYSLYCQMLLTLANSVKRLINIIVSHLNHRRSSSNCRTLSNVLNSHATAWYLRSTMWHSYGWHLVVTSASQGRSRPADIANKVYSD